MNSRRSFSIAFWVLILFSSCSKDDEPVLPDPELTTYELTVIEYFKEIALGFEFGDASKVTRRWNSGMKIFIGGNANPELLVELDTIVNEINHLVSNGFRIEIVGDSIQSNFYIFFGGAREYLIMFPSLAELVEANWGLFSIHWNDLNELETGHMYIDVRRANLKEQKHLLREEFTQSLGLARDSPLFIDSIFQSAWTTTNVYAEIDRDLIRLLYHPKMFSGLKEKQVVEILSEILKNE